jgi:hypothetical protein
VGLNDVGLHITTVTEFSADKASVNYGVHSSVLTRAKDKNGCQKTQPIASGKHDRRIIYVLVSMDEKFKTQYCV